VQEVLKALDHVGADLPDRLKSPILQHFEARPEPRSRKRK
jgi:hypothetical protein